MTSSADDDTKTAASRRRARPKSLPSTADEFEAYMREMDLHFVSISLPIAARELAAVAEAGFDQGHETVRMPARRDPTPGKYDGEDLLLRASLWFTSKYPEQSKIDSSLGSTVVLLHGQVWEYRVPLGGGRYLLHAGDVAMGPATIAVSTGYPLIPPGHFIRKTLPPFNLIKGVVGLPEHIAAALSRSEQYLVVQAFCRGQLAYFWLTRARKHVFVRGAIGDLASSTHHLLRSPAELGLSRWASLQTVEKVLKSYLSHAGQTIPTRGRKAHDVADLANTVLNCGGPHVPESDLAQVHCPAAVRYDAQGQTLVGAVDAHYSALSIVNLVATELCKRYPLPTTPRLDDPSSSARDMIDFIAERAGLHGRVENCQAENCA